MKIIGILTVTDPDVGQRHTCQVTKILESDAMLFHVETQGHWLRLMSNQPLNFEERYLYDIEISCNDSEPLFVTKSLVIKVLGKRSFLYIGVQAPSAMKKVVLRSVED